MREIDSVVYKVSPVWFWAGEKPYKEGKNYLLTTELEGMKYKLLITESSLWK